MNQPRRIVVIGGTACGPKAAARARRCDPEAKITIVEQGDNLSVATCGFPYYISGIIERPGSLVTRGPAFFKDVMNIDVLTGTRAIAIDRNAKKVSLEKVKTGVVSSLEYDKLVIATGNRPAEPDLRGRQHKGVFVLNNLADAVAIRDFVAVRKVKQATVIGAGLIGLEVAEALTIQGLEVTVVEALDWMLPAFIDFEIAAYLKRHLESKGVKFHFGQRVLGFNCDTDGFVCRLIARDNEMESQLVLLAIGVRPNIWLAREAGLAIGSTGGIAVNEYMETSDPDIYAGGDCVENVSRLTGQKMLMPLGSVANKHGRVIGTNVSGGRETFLGVLGTAAAKVFDYNLGRTGLSEAQARASGFDVLTALVPASDHATYYPGSQQIMVKLVVNKASSKILGGQVVGPGEAAKRVDVLATAISLGATVDDLADLDLTYAPPFNSAMDPLHYAAAVIRNKRDGLVRSITPMEVKKKLDSKEDFILLDVRSPGEWELSHIEAPQVKLLPLPELRQRLNELPKNKEIITSCQVGIRAYQAQRILEGAGFKNAKLMDGSLTAWPYEVVQKKID
jgi:NADPH-dependent 2,4-dienoyl-CoA reductase/sulfur reductase-like enzyme/rhodanese-related sulfurtransferase